LSLVSVEVIDDASFARFDQVSERRANQSGCVTDLERHFAIAATGNQPQPGGLAFDDRHCDPVVGDEASQS
jgi:hypothetical protein